MLATPKVTVVVVNYGTSHLIPRLLASVSEAESILIVDNYSTPAERKAVLALEAPGVQVLACPNNGYGAAFNLSFKFVPQDHYILLANPDAYFEVGAFRALLEDVTSLDVDLASPIILDERTRAVWYAGGAISHLTSRVTHYEYGSPVPRSSGRPSTFISGCLLLVSPRCREVIGKMQEHYFLYWEDADYSLRAIKAGCKLAVSPTSLAVHSAGTASLPRYASGTSALTNYYQARNWLLFAQSRSRGHRLVASFAAPLFFLRDSARLVRHESQAIRKISALAAGLRDGLRRRTGPTWIDPS